MAADIVPVRLGLTQGDLYTLWAPLWRDSEDEWEAFLGKDEDLYGFASVADLVAFVRTDTDNDLADHPAWESLAEANAHRLDPKEERRHDLVAVPEVVSAKPTEDSVTALRRTLQGDIDDFPKDVLELIAYMDDAKPGQPVAGPKPTLAFEQLRAAQGPTQVVREQSDYYHATKTTIFNALRMALSIHSSSLPNTPPPNRVNSTMFEPPRLVASTAAKSVAS